VNFNVYLDATTAKRLERSARRLGKPRNALIREAVQAWLEHEGPGWPDVVVSFEGDPKAPRFEAHRKELGVPRKDPLG
jgi:hypothetical protein